MRSPWRPAYEEALSQDDDCADFQVLHAPAAEAKPLLIWVHPGDAVEDEEGFDDRDDYLYSRDLQQQMGYEIERLAATHQVVILHRQSSEWAFDQEHAEYVYLGAFDRVVDQPDTVHLYGDDLESAGRWIATQMLAQSRPVFMTGAYSDAEHGCVSQVGRTLEALSSSPIVLSAYSPSDPASTDGQWTPRPAVAVAPTPARRTRRVP